MIFCVICALVGAALALLVQYEWAVYRATRRPPTKAQIDDLRRALATWAERYQEAKPTGRYAKAREAELYAACTKVGLLWVRPLPTSKRDR
jgi:hypothetical protein